jgi:glycerophosphoryl diester phosphodiesterase
VVQIRSGFQIVAHRGSSLRAPENSIPAFDLALAERASGIEFDLRRTLDGELVAIHDEEVARTISLRGRPCTGRVAEWLSRDLCMCTATGAERRRPDHGPPRLDQIISRYASRSRLFVHLKDATGDGTVEDRIARSIPRGPHHIISSHVGVLRSVKLRAPHLRTVLLIEQERSLSRLDPRIDCLSPRSELVDAMTTRLARRHGLEVFPHTVNDMAELERLLELGVDGVITDDPRAAAETVESWMSRVVSPNIRGISA